MVSLCSLALLRCFGSLSLKKHEMNIAAKYQKGDVLYAENINSLPLRHLVLRSLKLLVACWVYHAAWTLL